MAQYVIETYVLMKKMGFETLEDEEIQKEIYLEICSRIEDELMIKRNKFFGWSDSRGIDIEGESFIDTYWVIAIDGRIIQIDLEYEEIRLDGNSQACLKLGKKLLKFVGNLSQASILRKVKSDLTADQQAILKKWKNRNKAQKKRNLG